MPKKLLELLRGRLLSKSFVFEFAYQRSMIACFEVDIAYFSKRGGKRENGTSYVAPNLMIYT